MMISSIILSFISKALWCWYTQASQQCGHVPSNVQHPAHFAFSSIATFNLTSNQPHQTINNLILKGLLSNPA
ncbi:hypothetical protein CLAIMM_13116 [Cladophialophora immunda]|nr:hypothetical protein CLAIMM_13116 [Cladophialophora immunda]